MSLTKEQWAKVEQAISGIVGSASLLCDGYVVQLEVMRSKQKLVIGIYIDGSMAGEWVTDPGTLPEQKFLPIRSRSRYSAKDLKDMEKSFGKRWMKKKGYYEKYQYCDLKHNTPKAAISHLKKACDHMHLLCAMGVTL